MCKISIIIPVYNAENYLDRCINSILTQNFSDFELILVDDGSIDSSGKICDTYAKTDQRIKVIHKSNGGVSSARNEGIKMSTGKYLMFCDSDDYVDESWCKYLYDQIEKNPNSWVIADMHSTKLNDYLRKDVSHSNLTYFEIYKMGLSAYVVNKIYDSSIIKSNNIMFNNECMFGEDVIFNVDYVKYCNNIIFINEKLYYYVNNEYSIMNTYKPNLLSLHLPIFKVRLSILRAHEIEEYCDIWLCEFISLFKNIFDEQNKMSFFQKIKYNQRMIKSDEFRFCLMNATGNRENPLVLKIYSTYNYYLVWLFERLVEIKNCWRKK